MTNRYGTERVLEPKYVLPTSAWRLDNNRILHSNEMRIDISKIHIENTSFKQICLEANNDEQAIRQKIIDIVIKRGKLHNPITDTGGLAYGTVTEIARDFDNEKKLTLGEQVLCNCSTANLPMYISRIKKIDMAFGQIDVEGYAIVNSGVSIVRKPSELPLNIFLYIFNESGTLFRAASIAKGQQRVLVVGNNLLNNLIFGYVIRKSLGDAGEISCMLDKKSDVVVRGKAVDKLMTKVFNHITYVNILEPMECLNSLGIDEGFDISVNCADIPGAETINILATKYGGTVLFANLINNYNIALYITEAISRHLEIKNAEGYLQDYDQFDVKLVEELAPQLANITFESVGLMEAPIHHTEVNGTTGQSKTMMEEFVCSSRKMQEVFSEMITVAKYDCNILITGETGVGKEKVANIIQKNSARNMQPFIKINCASIAPSLIESEFFGYEKGAFTGANARGKKGYFEVANNGIIFLDEIGELPLDMQAKLLRVIQDGEFYRVGGTTPIKTNVRIISATNRDLDEFIENHRFRRDLYYRLNVVQIRVPRLNDRIEDIPELISLFLKNYGKKFGIARGIEPEAVEFLKQRSWPGNIRELENIIQRMMINAQGSNITLVDAMKEINGDVFSDVDYRQEVEATGGEMILTKLVDDFEKNIIKYACEKYSSTRKAAKAIGISQTQLVRKKKKYEIN